MRRATKLSRQFNYPGSSVRDTTIHNVRPDVLRRFASTTHTTYLSIMGRTIHLESDRPGIIRAAQEFFARYRAAGPSPPGFRWRIVSSPHDGHRLSVDCHAFSDQGLRFANVGQKSFLAVDISRREAIVFADESAIESEPRLTCRSVFDTLFSMCAGPLSLSPLSAACVGKGDRGVLVLGRPNSGKTTTAYLAARSGLEFHGDQAVFVETDSMQVKVWGDLMPAVFRSESLEFLPELQSSTRCFSYSNLTVNYLSKRPFQSREARPVSTVCCVFLNRNTTTGTSVVRIERNDLKQRLRKAVLFHDDEYQEQDERASDMLANLPGYEVIFQDPADAADVVCGTLAQPRQQDK